MTLGNFLSQMGIAPKQLTERFSHVEYGAAAHDPHMLYAYEQPHEYHATHSHVAAPKHHHYGYGGHGHKSNAAMSALTLLSFLFFLHILQQCLREHMAAMNANPTVVVMTGTREGEEPIAKAGTVDKFDKTGTLDIQAKNTESSEVKRQKENETQTKKENAFDNIFTRISASEYTPSIGGVKYKRILNKNHENTSLSYSGFVNAMTDQ